MKKVVFAGALLSIALGGAAFAGVSGGGAPQVVRLGVSGGGGPQAVRLGVSGGGGPQGGVKAGVSGGGGPKS